MRFLLTPPPLTTGLLALGVCTIAFTPCPVFVQQANAQPANAKDNGSYGPLVSIVSPEYSDVIKDVTAITIEITPRRYPAQSVELLVDGKAVSGVLPVTTKFKWDTKLFVDGPHTLGVRVTDTQGFIGQAETTVYINNNRKKDDSSPILRWLGVESGQKLTGVATIGLEAADNFGVKYVFLNLNSAISPDIKPPLASWMTNRPPYEFAVDTSRFADGVYVLDAYAWDAMENERTAPRLTVSFSNNTDSALAPEAAPLQSSDDKAKGDKAKSEAGPQIAKAPAAATGKSTTPAPAQRLAQAPQETITTTDNGWISSTPAPQSNPTPDHAERITRVVSAKISDPKSPASKETETSPPPDRKLEVASPTAPLQESVAANAPAPGTASAPQVRIARSDIIDAPAAQNPKATLTRENTGAARTQLTTPPTASANATRVAVAPEVRWTTPSESRNQSSVNAATTLSPLETPASRSTPGSTAGAVLLAQNSRAKFQMTSPSNADAAENNQPKTDTAPLARPTTHIQSGAPEIETNREAIAARPTTPLFAALPKIERANTTEKSAVNAQLTSVDKGHNTRLVFAAPYSPLRTTSTPALPTVPRLAFSPNLSKPSASAPEGAAITVAPSLDAPVVHVATHNDTLAAIAARYKMPVSAVAAANGLKADAQVVKGTKVLLPQALLVSYKGQAVTGDVAPLLIGSTSVAPFRFMFEKQGGTMEWDGAAQRVIARNGDHQVTLEIGSDKAMVNEKEVLMDMAAFLLSGRTMVPVRFFEKALNAKVEWEPTTGRIFVAMTP